MKKLVILANCQFKAIGETLFETSCAKDNFEWVKILPIHRVNDNDLPVITKAIKDSDVLIHQYIEPGKGFRNKFNTEIILENISNKTKLISIPSVYFDGYFPHLSSLFGWGTEMNLMHDFFIAYLSCMGKGVGEILELINFNDLYDKEMSLSLVHDSIKNLENREVSQSLDINISKYIKDNYKESKLFNQFNHPKREVIVYIVNEILNDLGFPGRVPVIGKSFLDTIEAPIYKSTYNNLGLNFTETHGLYKTVAGNKNETEMVSNYIKFYSGKDKNKIIAYIEKSKPFIRTSLEKVL